MKLLKRLTVACAVALAVVTIPTITYADEISPAAVASKALLTFSPVQWSAITGFISVFVIWLATKVGSSYTRKVLVTIVVTTLGAIVERAVLLPDGSAVVSAGLILDAFLVGGIGQWVYKLLKGDGKIERALLPNVGI